MPVQYELNNKYRCGMNPPSREPCTHDVISRVRGRGVDKHHLGDAHIVRESFSGVDGKDPQPDAGHVPVRAEGEDVLGF